MNNCLILGFCIVFLVEMTVSTPAITTLRLSDDCYRDRDCESIENSRCHLGYCRCQPFYAEHNGTRCVESTLLGNDCLVPEQCYMKVANSSCLAGVCRCEEGFLQFRRHTCLTPARLGHVCYSHEHCRLWDSDTHCDFLIPDLFGRCQCTAPMKRDGEVCRPDTLVIPPTFTTLSPLISNIYDGKDDNSSQVIGAHDEFVQESDNGTETGVQVAWLKNATKLLSSPVTQRVPGNLITRPMFRTRKPVHEDTNELPEDNDAIIIDADITEITQTTQPSVSTPTKADRHETVSLNPASLGQLCTDDLECRMTDTHSRCIDGLCDCAIRDNATRSCGARRTGCPAGTFQCRGSGACISWFFVCDGRPDCGDGSDEECAGSNCPYQSFNCKRSGVCISRAGQCDGRLDCPHGEDEENCKNRRKCPEGSFRCNNGQCLPAYEFCNAVVSCRDGSDEPRGACRTRNRGRVSARNCPFRCANGRCRSDAITCSGRDGCGDGSDEINCSVCKCPAVPSWKNH